uniref:Uncharacterized protein n=1 Tax=Meloidogyne enterolobii TaxID=390850 RepID=A0A6V7WNG7_MELEN|nr:unnamed protein product [Meloidogyne enterolobii]
MFVILNLIDCNTNKLFSLNKNLFNFNINNKMYSLTGLVDLGERKLPSILT